MDFVFKYHYPDRVILTGPYNSRQQYKRPGETVPRIQRLGARKLQ